jgi:hypothetical protein
MIAGHKKGQEIKNPRSKLRGIGGRKEADQKNAASCGEYVPKEIQPQLNTDERTHNTIGSAVQAKSRH